MPPRPIEQQHQNPQQQPNQPPHPIAQQQENQNNSPPASIQPNEQNLQETSQGVQLTAAAGVPTSNRVHRSRRVLQQQGRRRPYTLPQEPYRIIRRRPVRVLISDSSSNDS